MTALSSLVRIPTIPRRQRAAVTVALGLSAGAVGWSGLAQAAGEETASQVLLLPEHYELLDNGVVVFKLETGENLSLTSDQYLIMEDGLLLITDELAQASVYSLPVMGSVRAQLISDLAPVATIDGTVAEATPSQTLAITQGTAPRLSEQVDLQSYELAQASDGSSSEVGEAVAVGLSVSPGAMALLGMLMTSDQPEASENQAPVFASSTASTSVIENTSGTVYTASASDPDTGDTVTFSLDPSSADEAAFSITANGALSFQSAPDYESPTDDGTDNAYVVGIVAEDGNGGTATQTLTVTVTDAVTPGTGFVINGIDAGDYSGRSVSSAGDINGDGIDDLIIGAYGADPDGNFYAGETYVVFGKDTTVDGTFASALELSDLDVGDGFVINGIDAHDNSGRSVSSAGDINGDGIDDLIIGAPDADPNGDNGAGETYVVFGKDTAVATFAATLELSSLDGTNGFVIEGINVYDFIGKSVSSAGDINGDGIDDLIIGASAADPNGDSNAGASYVVFGRNTAVNGNFDSTLDLSNLTGTNGFVIEGVTEYDFSGYSVSSAGDINGDGIDDLIIGAPDANPNDDNFAGESYVVFGRNTAVDGTFDSTLELSGLDGSNGFVIEGFLLEGIGQRGYNGESVSSAGDINGDGIDDLIVGAYGIDSYTGESYVVFGTTDAFAETLKPSNLDGSNGFVINGIDANDRSGKSVSSAGDINGDGIDDLIIGAHRADPNDNENAGESYVVFGKDTAFAPTLELLDLNGANGFVIEGINEYDFSGEAVSSAGDINGDGIDDLVIGAPDADPNGDSNAGESYVVFGTTEAWSASIDLDML